MYYQLLIGVSHLLPRIWRSLKSSRDLFSVLSQATSWSQPSQVMTYPSYSGLNICSLVMLMSSSQDVCCSASHMSQSREDHQCAPRFEGAHQHFRSVEPHRSPRTVFDNLSSSHRPSQPASCEGSNLQWKPGPPPSLVF